MNRQPARLPDRLTLVAISSMAYVLAVALHEHLGHASVCVLLGSHPVELGAFYVNCDNARLSAASIRAVALAGPLLSLLTGVISFLLLPRLPRGAATGYYFVWLLGSIGLMSAAGYPLFSGISGVGDLSLTSGGAFYGAQPQWLWHCLLTAFGFACYWFVVWLSVRTIEPRLSGSGDARIRSMRLTGLTSYASGAAAYLAIGVLNPYGLQIVLLSVLPASLGGTSGLAWMTRLMDPSRTSSGPGLYFPRNWYWIGVSVAVTLAYALILGPTLRP